MSSSPALTKIKDGTVRDFFGGHISLWKTADYLLLITNSIYSEQYKRFYFRDIQAIIIQQNKRREVLSIFAALLTALFILLAAQSHEPVFSFYGFLAAVSAIFLLVNWLKGPTCSCHILTRVQKVPLAVRRIKKARRIIEELNSIVHQVQGALADLKNAENPSLTAPTPEPSGHHRPESALEASDHFDNIPRLSFYQGHWHTPLFAVLLVNALLLGLKLLYPSSGFFMLVYVVAAVLLALIVMALIRQRHSSLSKSLKQLTWAAFALQASGLVLMIILSFQVLLASPDLFIKSEYILAKTIAGLDPSDYPVLLFGLVLLMFGSLFTGASGLIVLFRRQQKSGTGVPLIREDGSIADQAPPMPPSPEQR